MRPFYAIKIFIVHSKIMYTEYLYCISAISRRFFISLSIFSDFIDFRHDIKYKNAKLLYSIHRISSEKPFCRNIFLKDNTEYYPSLYLYSKTHEFKRYINKINQMKNRR